MADSDLHHYYNNYKEKDDEDVDDDDDDDNNILNDQDIIQPILLVGIPIVITLVLVCALVSLTCQFEPDYCYQGTLSQEFPPNIMESSGQSFGMRTTKALITALVGIGAVATMTFIMVLVFYFNLTWFMMSFIFFAYSYMMVCVSFFIAKNISYIYNISMDWPVTCLLVWNVTCTCKFFCNFVLIITLFFLVYQKKGKLQTYQLPY